MTSLGWLPAFEGMETLFSWASKTHLAGAQSARTISLQLFGNLRAARMHSTVCHIGHLTRVTGGLLGSPEELLSKRTSLAGFLPFMTEARRFATLRALIDGSGAEASLRLGLRASRLPALEALRYCASCAKNDLHDFGYSRWHVVHQLPAVWICPEHQEELVELSATAFAWQLAGEHPLNRPQFVPRGNIDTLGVMAAIMVSAYRLGSVNSDGLREAALARCCTVGLVVNPRRLSAQSINDAFRATPLFRWISAYGPLRALAGDQEWMVSLLRCRTADHPVKWAIIWAFLWQHASRKTAVEAFVAAAGSQSTIDSGSQLDLWPQADRVAMRLCLARVEDAMSKWNTLEEVQKCLGITYQVLSRWIAENPSLRERWSLRLRDSHRSMAVDRVKAFLLRTPEANLATLTKSCSADIRWLQRHFPVAASELLSLVPRQRQRSASLFSR